MPEPALPARLELKNLESRAEQTGLTDSDIERELEGIHAKRGNILRPEDFQRAPHDEKADAGAAAATEHSHGDTGVCIEIAHLYFSSFL